MRSKYVHWKGIGWVTLELNLYTLPTERTKLIYETYRLS